MTPLSICEGCLQKQRQIDQLIEENQRLKQQLRYRQRQVEQGPFGSSTPSSKIPVKASSLEENQTKKGGARPGHSGHGRSSFQVDSADRVEEVGLGWICPQCGGPLQDKGYQPHSVIDSPPLRAERLLYRLKKNYCPHCRRLIQARAPGVLPRSLYGNQLIAHSLLAHYLHGIPLGRISEQTSIAVGTVIDIFHRLAALLRALLPRLMEESSRSGPPRRRNRLAY